MKVLNNPIFPVHKFTFQGVATNETMDDKPYKAVHADDDCEVIISFETGDVTLSLGKGEDISVSGATSITSDVSIKVS